jgi:hypothetical protein
MGMGQRRTNHHWLVLSKAQLSGCGPDSCQMALLVLLEGFAIQRLLGESGRDWLLRSQLLPTNVYDENLASVPAVTANLREWEVFGRWAR